MGQSGGWGMQARVGRWERRGAKGPHLVSHLFYLVFHLPIYYSVSPIWYAIPIWYPIPLTSRQSGILHSLIFLYFHFIKIPPPQYIPFTSVLFSSFSLHFSRTRNVNELKILEILANPYLKVICVIFYYNGLFTTSRLNTDFGLCLFSYKVRVF